jgi:hypothetical protein
MIIMVPVPEVDATYIHKTPLGTNTTIAEFTTTTLAL